MKKFNLLITGLFTLAMLTTCNLDKIEEPPVSGDKPVAAFDITNAGCTAPCQVVFTNKSTDATTFEWDFGDGSPKVTQGNPTHAYESPGDYIVKLTATGPGGTDLETKPVLINVRKFTKTIGGVGEDASGFAQQTADGGYIITGYTLNEGAGQFDVYLIKTDIDGNLTWKNTFGGALDDFGSYIQQTTDGGYIIAAGTNSEGAGQLDAYLIKTNSLGTLIWKQTFGDINIDYINAVQQTTDGGYIVAGGTKSEGAGGTDIYLIKTDNAGNLVWKKTFGGANDDSGDTVQQTTDGGYIITGSTASEGNGSNDFYLVKTDPLGNLVWKKTFGGVSDEYAFSGQQTADGGYIMSGYTKSEGAGGRDAYLIKTDNAGNEVWKQTFGGIDDENGTSVQQTADGGYIITGYTASEGAGTYDIYLVKTDNTGNQVWKNTFGGVEGDYGKSVRQTSDGGYIVLGKTFSFGAGFSDIYLIKTDKDGNAQ